jgi:hypothetical protein
MPEATPSGVAEFIGTFGSESTLGLIRFEALVGGGSEGVDHIGDRENMPGSGAGGRVAGWHELVGRWNPPS